MAMVVSCWCNGPPQHWKSGGRVALPVGNEYTMYSMVGSSRLSNLHQSFFIHDQPLAFQLDNLFSQRRPHLVCRNKTSTVSILKSVMPDVIVQESSNEHTPSVWTDFARHVSGEWDGYGAEFSIEGQPIELPESVVPEAFREWDVQVYDWQTQCPTLAEENTIAIRYKSIRLLPTVGCEADAATQHSVDERQIGGVDNEVSSFAFHSSGCYIAVWPGRSFKKERHVPPAKDPGQEEEECNILEIEHCLVEGQNSESRVRIIQQIHLGKTNEEQKTGPSLKKVTVYCEQWYGPFRNGEQLGGCAISGSAFASTSPLHASQLAGTWQAQNLVAGFETESELFKGLVDDESSNIIRDLKELVLLPKNLWCTFKIIENQRFISEAGWLLDPKSTITSNCEFSFDGKLKKIIVRFEEQCSSSSEGLSV